MKIIYSKVLVLASLLIGSLSTYAQKDTRANIGIGTTSPNQSAILDIQSSNKGLLMPRMSLQQRNSILNPADGLIIYQTDMLSGFYYFDGKEWKPLSEGNGDKSIAIDPNDWSLNGNANATAASFIGTPAGIPINFKIGTSRAGTFSSDANAFFGLGFEAGIANTTGALNLGLGYQALKANTTGGRNVAIGATSLLTNTTGSFNTAVGPFTMQLNTTGTSNLALGVSALSSNTTASNNIAIGGNSLKQNTTGGNNTAIGAEAGRLGTVGTGNVFIGFSAGYNETGSNKLYMANSSTANPLIKGEFDNKNLKVNTGAAVSSTVGFLAVGNFDAAYAMPASNSYRLIVQDGIITEKVKVALKSTADWADYVFEPSYKLMSLEKVEEFVKENKHLPNVPSAEDMSKNGLDVSQTSAKLMEKIEELTLYMIEMNKEIKALKEENERLKK